MKLRVILTINLLFFCSLLFAQNEAQTEEIRIQNIRTELEKLAGSDPDILREVDIQVTDDDIQTFIGTVVKTAQINISIDPSVEARVTNHFTDVKALDVILYLCRNYKLDAKVFGNIVYLTKHETPREQTNNEPNIEFNNYSSRLTLSLERDSLYKVVRSITTQTGENIILAPNVNKNEPVTLFLKDVNVDEAIRNLGYSLNYSVTKDNGKAYYFERADGTRKSPSQETEQKPQPPQTPEGFTPSKSFTYQVDPVSRRIDIDAVKVPIAELIQILTKETDQSYVLMTEIAPTDVATIKANNLTYDEFLDHVFKGKKYTFTKEDGFISIGKEEADLFLQEIFQFESRSFAEVMPALPTQLTTGIEIKEFKELNSLLINGPKYKVNRLMQTLHLLDKVVPQVHMEIIVVDVNKSNTIDTGIKAGLTPSDSTTVTQGQIFPNTNGYFTMNSTSVNGLVNTINQTGLLNLGKVAPNFYLQLKAVETNGNSKVRSTNRLSALNGHEASFAVGEKIFYYVENDLATPTFGQGNVSVYTTRQLESVEANFAVKITPFVSGDGQVTLEVDVDFSSFTGDPPTVNTQPPPSISSQKFTSLIRVQDRDMVVLGGLERESQSEDRQGVPFLSKIPIIKWFVSDKQKTKSESSLLIFIRPTIIY